MIFGGGVWKWDEMGTATNLRSAREDQISGRAGEGARLKSSEIGSQRSSENQPESSVGKKVKTSYPTVHEMIGQREAVFGESLVEEGCYGVKSGGEGGLILRSG